MYGGYSICLNKWALDKNIKNELGLLLIISSLTAEKGYCFASNQRLAEIFETTEVSISRKLKKLVEKGYINIEYKKKGCQVINRKIRLTKMLTDDYQKCYSTINKNVKDNNISNTTNNISNKRKYIKESERIVSRLNELNDSHYKPNTEETLKLITGIFNEGYTEEDLLLVVEKMSYLWNREPKRNEKDMRPYLRPSTLFRKSNFENYLNMPVNVPTDLRDVKEIDVMEVFK